MIRAALLSLLWRAVNGLTKMFFSAASLAKNTTQPLWQASIRLSPSCNNKIILKIIEFVHNLSMVMTIS